MKNFTDDMMTHKQIIAHFLKWTINFINSIPSENVTKSLLCLYSLDGSFKKRKKKWKGISFAFNIKSNSGEPPKLWWSTIVGHLWLIFTVCHNQLLPDNLRNLHVVITNLFRRTTRITKWSILKKSISSANSKILSLKYDLEKRDENINQTTCWQFYFVIILLFDYLDLDKASISRKVDWGIGLLCMSSNWYHY